METLTRDNITELGIIRGERNLLQDKQQLV